MTTSFDRSLLLDVLLQGEEDIQQLESLLEDPSSSELCKPLAQRIHALLRTAISMASEGSRQPAPVCTNTTPSGSPTSHSESPRSENSDRVLFKEPERRLMSKKRKSLPKWTSQVRLDPGVGLEAPLDDGYCWRKYGQKDILGAKHPRGYYRCTHRNAQGCMATKQVQRSDDDPSILDVTYQGDHTCVEKYSRMPRGQPKHTPLINQELLLCSPNGLGGTEIRAGKDSSKAASSSSSFSFLNPEDHHYSPCTLMGTFSSPLVSTTAASGSDYFALSPCRMSSYGGGQSDLTDIVSAATSAVNSPVVDMDFMLDDLGSFPFDASSFFP